MLALALALCLCLVLASALAADSDFVIENGVLTQYNGSGGNVVILNGVTSIGENTSSGCTDLTSVAIPASVTSVGQAAFYNRLKVAGVYYSGSEEQWNAMQIGTFNSLLAHGSLARAAIHYNGTMPEHTAAPLSPDGTGGRQDDGLCHVRRE